MPLMYVCLRRTISLTLTRVYIRKQLITLTKNSQCQANLEPNVRAFALVLPIQHEG